MFLLNTGTEVLIKILITFQESIYSSMDLNVITIVPFNESYQPLLFLDRRYY